MATVRWNGLDQLKRYGIILGKKVGLIAVGWAVLYFISRPMRVEPTNGGVNALMLFGLLVGCLGGLVAGWYVATDAVEDSSLQGMTLWAILVGAAVLPMWGVDFLLQRTAGPPMSFGGWMMLVGGTLMALASAVWIASTQE
jgi:hypothetical protein